MNPVGMFKGNHYPKSTAHTVLRKFHYNGEPAAIAQLVSSGLIIRWFQVQVLVGPPIFLCIAY